MSVLASGGDLTDVPGGAGQRAFGRATGVARAAVGAVPPPGLLLLGMLSVQIGAGLAKNMFGVLPPAAVIALRLSSAAAALLVFARPRLRGHSARDLAVVGAFGLSLAVMNSAFYQAIDRLPLGVVVTIEFLGPLTVAVIGSHRVLDLLWVLLAGGGVLLLAWNGGATDLVGVAWALLAAGCWAVYIGLSAATGRRFPGASGLSAAMCLSALLVLPIGIAQGGGALLRPDLLAAGIGVGLLSSTIPYVLELEALRRMPAGLFGILMSLEPVLAALIGLLALGEVLALRQWVAIGCVIVASIGATRTHRRRPGPDA